MKTKNILQHGAVALCASAFFLGSATDTLAKGGKGGDKGGKGKTEKKGKSDKGGEKKDNKSDSKKGNDKKNDNKHDKKGGKHDKSDFDDDFRNFYKGGKNGLPPGLQKKVARGKGLPPGWKNKATKGWKIDDDYWKRLDLLDAADLPKNFKHKDGVGSYLLGDRILSVDKDTRTVIDFVDLVLD